MIETFTVLGAIAAIAAALLSAWQFWPRRPFTLERVDPEVAVLVRTRWPRVLVRQVWVYERGELATRDMAGTAECRILDRGGELFLDVSAIPTGEPVTVFWRRFWHDPKRARNRLDDDRTTDFMDRDRYRQWTVKLR